MKNLLVPRFVFFPSRYFLKEKPSGKKTQKVLLVRSINDILHQKPFGATFVSFFWRNKETEGFNASSYEG
jgi:hypothetical protein